MLLYLSHLRLLQSWQRDSQHFCGFQNLEKHYFLRSTIYCWYPFYVFHFVKYSLSDGFCYCREYKKWMAQIHRRKFVGTTLFKYLRNVLWHHLIRAKLEAKDLYLFFSPKTLERSDNLSPFYYSFEPPKIKIIPLSI